jgi:glycosyltransferase involved in cell wall biosynthesis
LRKEKTSWPRNFQYVGRYIPIKGIHELLAGYRTYREKVSDPMELRFCGQGYLADEIQKTPGVRDLGFLQPNDMAEALVDAGCFLLPSHYDPWAVALVDACAAGLPIIAGVGCGASVEVLRDSFNGVLLKKISSDAIMIALLVMHKRYSDWPLMGERSEVLALSYAPDHWATNVLGLVQELKDRAN